MKIFKLPNKIWKLLFLFLISFSFLISFFLPFLTFDNSFIKNNNTNFSVSQNSESQNSSSTVLINNNDLGKEFIWQNFFDDDWFYLKEGTNDLLFNSDKNKLNNVVSQILNNDLNYEEEKYFDIGDLFYFIFDFFSLNEKKIYDSALEKYSNGISDILEKLSSISVLASFELNSESTNNFFWQGLSFKGQDVFEFQEFLKVLIANLFNLQNPEVIKKTKIWKKINPFFDLQEYHENENEFFDNLVSKDFEIIDQIIEKKSINPLLKRNLLGIFSLLQKIFFDTSLFEIHQKEEINTIDGLSKIKAPERWIIDIDVIGPVNYKITLPYFDLKINFENAVRLDFLDFLNLYYQIFKFIYYQNYLEIKTSLEELGEDQNSEILQTKLQKLEELDEINLQTFPKFLKLFQKNYYEYLYGKYSDWEVIWADDGTETKQFKSFNGIFSSEEEALEIIKKQNLQATLEDLNCYQEKCDNLSNELFEEKKVSHQKKFILNIILEFFWNLKLNVETFPSKEDSSLIKIDQKIRFSKMIYLFITNSGKCFGKIDFQPNQICETIISSISQIEDLIKNPLQNLPNLLSEIVHPYFLNILNLSEFFWKSFFNLESFIQKFSFSSLEGDAFNIFYQIFNKYFNKILNGTFDLQNLDNLVDFTRDISTILKIIFKNVSQEIPQSLQIVLKNFLNENEDEFKRFFKNISLNTKEFDFEINSLSSFIVDPYVHDSNIEQYNLLVLYIEEKTTKKRYSVVLHNDDKNDVIKYVFFNKNHFSSEINDFVDRWIIYDNDYVNTIINRYQEIDVNMNIIDKSIDELDDLIKKVDYRKESIIIQKLIANIEKLDKFLLKLKSWKNYQIIFQEIQEFLIPITVITVGEEKRIPFQDLVGLSSKDIQKYIFISNSQNTITKNLDSDSKIMIFFKMLKKFNEFLVKINFLISEAVIPVEENKQLNNLLKSEIETKIEKFSIIENNASDLYLQEILNPENNYITEIQLNNLKNYLNYFKKQLIKIDNTQEEIRKLIEIESFIKEKVQLSNEEISLVDLETKLEEIKSIISKIDSLNFSLKNKEEIDNLYKKIIKKIITIKLTNWLQKWRWDYKLDSWSIRSSTYSDPDDDIVKKTDPDDIFNIEIIEDVKESLENTVKKWIIDLDSNISDIVKNKILNEFFFKDPKISNFNVLNTKINEFLPLIYYVKDYESFWLPTSYFETKIINTNLISEWGGDEINLENLRTYAEINYPTYWGTLKRYLEKINYLYQKLLNVQNLKINELEILISTIRHYDTNYSSKLTWILEPFTEKLKILNQNITTKFESKINDWKETKNDLIVLFKEENKLKHNNFELIFNNKDIIFEIEKLLDFETYFGDQEFSKFDYQYQIYLEIISKNFNDLQKLKIILESINKYGDYRFWNISENEIDNGSKFSIFSYQEGQKIIETQIKLNEFIDDYSYEKSMLKFIFDKKVVNYLTLRRAINASFTFNNFISDSLKNNINIYIDDENRYCFKEINKPCQFFTKETVNSLNSYLNYSLYFERFFDKIAFFEDLKTNIEENFDLSFLKSVVFDIHTVLWKDNFLKNFLFDFNKRINYLESLK